MLYRTKLYIMTLWVKISFILGLFFFEKERRKQMVTVTPSAKEKLSQILKEKQSSAAIRVYIAGFG